MSKGYEVIARRWRPKQFDEIVGQEHIVRTLKNAILNNRIAHAYLFVGPRGTGKTSTARIFAKALNAQGGPNIKPDDNSDLAKAIMNGSCMDVIEIDAASNTGVDNVRDLRESCQYAPAQGTFKIYIIDEVHMLSQGAFNALLKTLEEPPPHVKFIFATTESQKVLPTIVSRCQRFEFRPINDDLIVERLARIADSEKIQVDRGALVSVARLAQGGMRDAQSILDQMISFCGTQILEKDVLDVYGLVAPKDVEQLAQAMATANYSHILANIDIWGDEGRDLYRLLLDLQTYIRTALIASVRNNGKTDQLGITLTTESLMRMLDALHSGESSLRTGLSERVNFEVVLLRAIDQSRTRAIDSVIQQLTALSANLPQEAGKKKIEQPLTLDPPVRSAIQPPIQLAVQSNAKPPVEQPLQSVVLPAPTPEVKKTTKQPAEPTQEIKAISPKEKKPAPPLIPASNPLPASSQHLLNELFRAEYHGIVKLNLNEWIMRDEAVK